MRVLAGSSRAGLAPPSPSAGSRLVPRYGQEQEQEQEQEQGQGQEQEQEKGKEQETKTGE